MCDFGKAIHSTSPNLYVFSVSRMLLKMNLTLKRGGPFVTTEPRRPYKWHNTPRPPFSVPVHCFQKAPFLQVFPREMERGRPWSTTDGRKATLLPFTLNLLPGNKTQQFLPGVTSPRYDVR